MGSSWLVAYLVLAALAILQAMLMGLQTWEHRRFARSRLRTLNRPVRTARVMVLAPCKGVDVRLEENLRRLFCQDYCNYEIIFIVESVEDPACGLIRRLMSEHPRIVSRLVVAGRAPSGGQKVHNLRVATTQLPPDVECLAFVDSDAQPGREWLGALVERLWQERVGATTGYRWFVPERSSLANHLLYSINCGVAFLFGKSGPSLIWGGSWAIRREVFESIGLHEAWEGTLSDDLVASNVLRRHRLRVKFEPACVVASPLEGNLRQMFSFIRRQYTIGRFYVPAWWMFAMFFVTLSNLVLWIGLGMIGWGLATAATTTWIPACVCAGLYGLYVYRGVVRQDLARLYFPHLYETLRSARHFDTWAGPLAGLANWIGLLSSMLGRKITWRGITYQLYHGGQSRIVRRDDRSPLPEIKHQANHTESDTAAEKLVLHRKAG